MPRPQTNVLPNIAIKFKAIKKAIVVTPQLEAELAEFASFYQEQTSAESPPTESDVIVGILNWYLNQNSDFKRYKNAQTPDAQKLTKSPKPAKAAKANEPASTL